jgi:hypothetical protein
MEGNDCGLIRVIYQNLPRRLGKTTKKNLVQDSCCFGRDSNQVIFFLI